MLIVGLALADLHTYKDLSRFELLGHRLVNDHYTLPFGLMVAGALLAALGLARRPRAVAEPATPAAGSRWQPTTFERGVMWAGLACAALSLAPVWIALSELVPGLEAQRVPTRIYPYVSFAIALLAARGFHHLNRSLDRNGRRLLRVAAITVLLLESRAVVTWTQVPELAQAPPVYRALRDLPEVRAVAHFPVNCDSRDAWYMYFSPVHRRPIANGYSSFTAHDFAWSRACPPLPNQHSVAELRRIGVSHIVVHERGRRGDTWRRQLRVFEDQIPALGLRPFASYDSDRLLLLPPAEPPHA